MADAGATGASRGTYARNVRSGRKPRNPHAAKPNQVPVAAIRVTSAKYVSDGVVVSTEGTTDPDGQVVSGTITWGDGGSTAYDPDIEDYSHVYLAAGTYTITLTVRDNAGATARSVASVTLVVEPDPEEPPEEPPAPEPENFPPTAVLTYVSGQFRGQPYVLSTAGTQDLDGTIDSYSMDWGDGTTDTGSTLTSELTHTYANAGTYEATLTVTDDDGAPGTASRTIQIQSQVEANQSPSCTITKTAGFYVGQFAFALTASDPDGSIVSYSVDWGDGTSTGTVDGAPPSSLTHTYSSAASRTATFTVTDNSGATDSDQAAFTVNAIPSPSGGDHAYYDSLAARSDVLFVWPFHSASELASYTKSAKSPPRLPVEYDAGVEACLQTIDPQGGGDFAANTPQQVHLPLVIPHGTSFLLTWDHQWSEGWTYLGAGYIPNAYKTYRVDLPKAGPVPVWIALKNFWQNTSGGTLGEYKLTVPNNYYILPPTTWSSETPGPRTAFYVNEDEWIRTWIHYDAANEQLSLWAATSAQGVVQLLDRIKYGFPLEGLAIFRLEDDTSYNNVLALNPRSYHWNRNVVVLSGVSYSTSVSLLSTTGL